MYNKMAVSNTLNQPLDLQLTRQPLPQSMAITDNLGGETWEGKPTKTIVESLEDRG